MNHGIEDGAGVAKKVGRSIKLSDMAIRHDKDAIVIKDGVETMGDGDDGVVLELLTEGSLDQLIGDDVARGGGLVEEEDLLVTKDGASKAEELALADTKTRAHLSDFVGELFREVADDLLEFDGAEGDPDVIVRELFKGVEVEAEGAREEDGILGDDGEMGSEVAEVHLADVDAVDLDLARGEFDDAEDGSEEGGLSSSSAAADTNLLAATDGKGEVVQGRTFNVSAVVEDDVGELDVSVDGPDRGAGRLLALRHEELALSVRGFREIRATTVETDVVVGVGGSA